MHLHPNTSPVASVLALPHLTLGRSEIHLWWAMVDAEEMPLEPFGDVLDAKEREYAYRLAFVRDRVRTILARGMLRYVLAAYGCGAAETLRFQAEGNGKPKLDSGSGGPSFNLSHTEALIMLAVAPVGIDVGVDIERVRPMPDARDLVERFFSTRERAAWRALPARRRQAAFFRLWTRKEAFVKATGEGLSRHFDTFSVTLDEPSRILFPDLPSWSLHHLEPTVGYVGALAATHPTPALQIARLAFVDASIQRRSDG